MKLWQRWGPLRAVDLTAGAVAVLAALAGPSVVEAVVLARDVDAAVAGAFARSGLPTYSSAGEDPPPLVVLRGTADPWGRPFHYRCLPGLALGADGCRPINTFLAVSAGPDGEVAPFPGWDADDIDAGLPKRPLSRLYQHAWPLGAAAAAYLLWLYAAARCWSWPRTASGPREVVHATLSALPVGLLASGVLLGALGGRDLAEGVGSLAFLVAPLPVAVAGSVTGLAVLAAVALRLRRPLDGVDGDVDQRGGDEP